MQVMHDGVRGVPDPVPGQPEAPGQVGVLVVQEVRHRESADGARRCRAEQAGAAAEEPDVDRACRTADRPASPYPRSNPAPHLVIAPPALLIRPSAASRIRLVVAATVGIGVQRGQQAGQPAGLRGGVVVEEGDELGDRPGPDPPGRRRQSRCCGPAAAPGRPGNRPAPAAWRRSMRCRRPARCAEPSGRQAIPDSDRSRSAPFQVTTTTVTRGAAATSSPAPISGSAGRGVRPAPAGYPGRHRGGLAGGGAGAFGPQVVDRVDPVVADPAAQSSGPSSRRPLTRLGPGRGGAGQSPATLRPAVTDHQIPRRRTVAVDQLGDVRLRQSSPASTTGTACDARHGQRRPWPSPGSPGSGGPAARGTASAGPAPVRRARSDARSGASSIS